MCEPRIKTGDITSEVWILNKTKRQCMKNNRLTNSCRDFSYQISNILKKH
jgi:hypothetical protein